MADATFEEVLGGRVAAPACICGHERGAHQVVAKAIGGTMGEAMARARKVHGVATPPGVTGDSDAAGRAKIAAEDFAGPHRSYPIVTEGDVRDAASLVGKAENPGAVKARIIAIAKRKGLEAGLPKSWTAAAVR